MDQRKIHMWHLILKEVRMLFNVMSRRCQGHRRAPFVPRYKHSRMVNPTIPTGCPIRKSSWSGFTLSQSGGRDKLMVWRYDWLPTSEGHHQVSGCWLHPLHIFLREHLQ